MTGGLWKTRVVVGSDILFVWIFDSSLHIQNTSKRKCHLDPPKSIVIPETPFNLRKYLKKTGCLSSLSWLSHLQTPKNTFTHSNQNRGFLKWWYPQNTTKWSFLVGKPMVVGYHHFRKPPNRICLGWTNQSNHVFQREDWISISSLPGNP